VIFGQWISGLLSFKIDVDFSYNFVKIAVMILAVFGLSYGLIAFNLDSENIYSHLRYVASEYESELKEFLGFRKLNISRTYLLYLYKAGKI
jgi:hypothetical protein